MTDAITNITKDNFSSLKGIYLIDFWAAWCGPCKVMNPVLDRFSTDPDLSAIKIGKINVDLEPELAIKFGVQGIPNFFLIRFTGDEVHPYEKLANFVGSRDELSFKKDLLAVLAEKK